MSAKGRLNDVEIRIFPGALIDLAGYGMGGDRRRCDLVSAPNGITEAGHATAIDTNGRVAGLTS
jgi:hypothetical protein